MLTGWADPAILDAHEAERWPITEQVSKYAMGTALALARQRSAVPVEVEDPGPAGDAARAALGATVVALNTPQYCCGGLNFGSFYEHSSIIAYDGEAAPGYTMYDFTPSTVPGCRTPHVWLRDGRSLYDAMGDGFTLLRFDQTADIDTIAAAARARRLPLSVLDMASDEAAGLYGHKLMLSRPGQRVAWRGDAAPANAMGLVDRLRGARFSPSP